jgi:hypothetical protein
MVDKTYIHDQGCSLIKGKNYCDCGKYKNEGLPGHLWRDRECGSTASSVM